MRAMIDGYAGQIRSRIEAAPKGSVFVCSDFGNVADAQTVRRNLSRLTGRQVLARVLKGVWHKPEYSDCLKENVAPDPDQIARALARSHRTIAPGGSAALNLLSGGSLEETQQLLGHGDIATTLVYSHALERAANQSENRIASAISELNRYRVHLAI